jgi:hypothetical protein
MARMDTARATPQAPPCPLPPPIQKSNAQRSSTSPVCHAPARVARVGGPGCQGCWPDGRQVGSILCSKVWGVCGHEGVWGGQDVPTAGKCKLHALVVCHACCSLFFKLPHAACRMSRARPTLYPSTAPFEVLFRIAGARFTAFLSWWLCRAHPQIEANRIVMEDPVDRKHVQGVIRVSRLAQAAQATQPPPLSHTLSQQICGKQWRDANAPEPQLASPPSEGSVAFTWLASSYPLDSVRGSVRGMPLGP